MEENIEIKKDENSVYEVGYHVLSTVSESDLPAEVAKIQSIISESGGVIISESFPESRSLAYEISKRVETKYNKFNKAYFGWIKFAIESGEITKVEGALKNNPNILRFLIVKTVRENTMYIPKVVSMRTVGPTDGEPVVSEMSEKQEKAPVSEEEIDKSIDELVIT